MQCLIVATSLSVKPIASRTYCYAGVVKPADSVSSCTAKQSMYV